MSLLSPVLRGAENGRLIFRCPGCNASHQIAVGEGPGPRWGYNGNAESPTFTPSVLVTYPANPHAGDDFAEWRTTRICHSFVIDGQMQFLSDCTHALAGKTVPLARFNVDECAP